MKPKGTVSMLVSETVVNYNITFSREECQDIGYELLPTIEGISVRGAFGDYYNAQYVLKGEPYGVTWIMEKSLVNKMLFKRQLKEVLE